MSTNEIVKYELDNNVAVITLNNPEARNALSSAMTKGIVDALNKANEDDNVYCAVITGAGKAFCAGVDLKELSTNTEVLNDDGPFLRAFSSFSKPLIGALNGFAMTGGLELALACDIRYAAKSAIFADTHAVVGLMPTWGMSQKLPRLVGISRAKEMSFTAKMVDANTALQWGLVDGIYDDNEVLEKAIAVAHTIAQNDTKAVRGIKQLIEEGFSTSLEEGLELEDKYSRPHNDSIDTAEIFKKIAAVKSRS